VDRRAEEEWSTPANIDIPPLATAQAAPIKVGNSAVKVDREALKQQFLTAAQANGTYPQNNPSGWATNFGNLFANSLADQLDLISEKAKVNAVDISGPLQQLGTEVTSYVSSAVKAFGSATLGLQRRTNLIWWKQSLYSTSKHESYRAFPRTVAAGLMALDLYQQIPIFSPASVASFLEEAVHSLPGDSAAAGRPLGDILREASEHPKLDVLRDEAGRLFATPVGRSPLLALIGHPSVLQGLDERGLNAILGVPLESPVTDAEWASWAFRDLQAGRATKDQPKKRNVKGTA
jgi:hypothetical protein